MLLETPELNNSHAWESRYDTVCQHASGSERNLHLQSQVICVSAAVECLCFWTKFLSALVVTA